MSAASGCFYVFVKLSWLFSKVALFFYLYLESEKGIISSFIMILSLIVYHFTFTKIHILFFVCFVFRLPQTVADPEQPM